MRRIAKMMCSRRHIEQINLDGKSDAQRMLALRGHIAQIMTDLDEWKLYVREVKPKFGDCCWSSLEGVQRGTDEEAREMLKDVIRTFNYYAQGIAMAYSTDKELNAICWEEVEETENGKFQRQFAMKCEAIAEMATS